MTFTLSKDAKEQLLSAVASTEGFALTKEGVPGIGFDRIDITLNDASGGGFFTPPKTMVRLYSKGKLVATKEVPSVGGGDTLTLAGIEGLLPLALNWA